MYTLGAMPLADALEQAALDFEGRAGEKIIVPITDGKEECDGRPWEVAARSRAQGFNDRIDVVGFAFEDQNTRDASVPDPKFVTTNFGFTGTLTI